jgi:hypothetical protein
VLTLGGPLPLPDSINLKRRLLRVKDSNTSQIKDKLRLKVKDSNISKVKDSHTSKIKANSTNKASTSKAKASVMQSIKLPELLQLQSRIQCSDTATANLEAVESTA